MSLRRATAGDAPACARIVRGWLDAADWMPGGPSEAELTAIMLEGFPKREVWVHGDPVDGYLSLDASAAHIWGLYVATPGQGIGKRLLDRVKAGRARLTLNSHTPNAAAHRFYDREGFRVVERDRPGNDGVTEIQMEWTA